ncbi:MAG: type II toxin-antitoxin system VapC family toxin [Phycisphaerae bacterium]
MKPKVYIETSVISYLTAKPTRDLIVAAHQQITREWWESARPDLEQYVSDLVIDEASAGNEGAAGERRAILAGIPLLRLTDESRALANKLVDEGVFPEKAGADALHVAVAIVNGMDYLVTWNCTHIANARTRHVLARFADEQGYECPTICTPEELIEA